MTKWGYALLVLFLALGLMPLGQRKARHLTLIITFMVLAYAFQSYGGLR
jgi:hypothetical protein